MSPRRSAAEALETRRRLVAEATSIACTDGLEGVTVGRLAGAAGLSKSGVTRHFATKERLQLETFDHAIGLFRQTVWDPVADMPPGLARLEAICANWAGYLSEFPGGCFLTAASAEFDGREGPVRDAIKAALERWLRVLAHEIDVAIAAGELAKATDARELAYEINALAVGANQARQLLGDLDAPQRSLALMRRAIEARR